VSARANTRVAVRGYSQAGKTGGAVAESVIDVAKSAALTRLGVSGEDGDTTAHSFPGPGDESRRTEALIAAPRGAETESADAVYAVRIVQGWHIIAFCGISARAKTRVVVSNAGQKYATVICRSVEVVYRTGIAGLGVSGIGGDAVAGATYLPGFEPLRAVALHVALTGAEAESAYVVNAVRIVVFGNMSAVICAAARAYPHIVIAQASHAGLALVVFGVDAVPGAGITRRVTHVGRDAHASGG
jgi:hypothetical protein